MFSRRRRNRSFPTFRSTRTIPSCRPFRLCRICRCNQMFRWCRVFSWRRRIRSFPTFRSARRISSRRTCPWNQTFPSSEEIPTETVSVPPYIRSYPNRSLLLNQNKGRLTYVMFQIIIFTSFQFEQGNVSISDGIECRHRYCVIDGNVSKQCNRRVGRVDRNVLIVRRRVFDYVMWNRKLAVCCWRIERDVHVVGADPIDSEISYDTGSSWNNTHTSNLANLTNVTRRQIAQNWPCTLIVATSLGTVYRV